MYRISKLMEIKIRISDYQRMGGREVIAYGYGSSFGGEKNVQGLYSIDGYTTL